MLRPFEEQCQFHSFNTPALEDADFDAKPIVMLVGQYSTGKTTFIRYLLEEDFPGMRIGPEPTTDKWNVVMRGQDNGTIPGNALAVDPKLQFRPLAKFGTAFLNRLQCSKVDAKVLENLTLIDTPGILAGEKQSSDRGYDFVKVLEWFAARVDRVLLLFDANKLDISDEFKNSIKALKAHDDKIRIVLNKSDSVEPQQLMRVYGALMWSLGKVLDSPEVVRVYIGSFWDQPFQHNECASVFNSEMADLLADLKDLNRHAALRKLNDFVKRTRSVKIQALILSELNKKLVFFGRERKKRELMEKLPALFRQIQDQYDVSPGDFPKVNVLKEKLQMADWSKFKQVEPQHLRRLDKLLAEDMTRMMRVLPETSSGPTPLEAGSCPKTPFKHVESLESDWHWMQRHQRGWIVANDPDYALWISDFRRLADQDSGKILGPVAKEELRKSNLPDATLSRIWKLVDLDEDGLLNEEEFAIAKYLIARKIEGKPLPNVLPSFLYPDHLEDE